MTAGNAKVVNPSHPVAEVRMKRQPRSHSLFVFLLDSVHGVVAGRFRPATVSPRRPLAW